MHWDISSGNAHHRKHGWSFDGKLNKPEEGWTLSQQDSSKISLLHLASAQSISLVSEHCCPEEDLVISYRQDPETYLSIRYSIVSSTSNRSVIQVTYAIQTQLFESYPTFDVSLPRISENEVSPINNWDLQGLWGAVVITPADVSQCSYRHGEDGNGFLRLFGGFMERGVIRKCRLRLIVSRAANSVEGERELEALISEPLPLLA